MSYKLFTKLYRARIIWLLAALVLVLAACTAAPEPVAEPVQEPDTQAAEAAEVENEAAGAKEEVEEVAAEAVEEAMGEVEDIVVKHSTDYLADETLASADGEMVDTSQWKKEGPYTIGFINWASSNSWVAQVDAELKHEASLFPEIEELIITSAEGDSNKQISLIEDMIVRGVDALLIIPVSGEAVAPAIEEATAAGIPVVVFSTSTTTDQYLTYLQADEVQFGRLIGDYLMEQLNCEGDIIVLNGQAGVSTSDSRRAGLDDAMAACPDGGAGINILAEEDTQWAYDQGKLATERMIAAFGDQIDGVWSQGGSPAQGAIDAFEAAGLPLVPITGEDNNGFMLAWKERLPQGFKSIAASEPTWQSRVALQAALKALQGIPLSDFYSLKVPTITEDEIDDYARPEYSDAYWTNSLLPKEIADELYLKDE